MGKESSTKLYELWEIYKDGKHGEVYEVVECCVPSCVGDSVKVFSDNGGKGLLRGECDLEDEDADTLVTMYSCLGTAKYKKVEKYIEISWQEAFTRILDDKPVYVGEYTVFTIINKYTDLRHELMADDLDDLLRLTDYYVQAEEE